MPEDTNQNTTPQLTPEQEQAARTALMEKARLLGVEFSNNIGTETLRQRVKEKMEGDAAKQEEQAQSQPNPFDSALFRQAKTDTALQMLDEVKKAEEPVRQLTLTEHLRAEKLKLVRCRIYNLNPLKNDLPGEIITIANEYLGTVRRFIPFGELTDEGWHIPQIMFDELASRKYLHVQTKTNKAKGSTNDVKTRYVKEFSLEVLEPLSKEEIKRLAVAQLAAGGSLTGDEDED